MFNLILTMVTSTLQITKIRLTKIHNLNKFLKNDFTLTVVEKATILFVINFFYKIYVSSSSPIIAECKVMYSTKAGYNI